MLIQLNIIKQDFFSNFVVGLRLSKKVHHYLTLSKYTYILTINLQTYSLLLEKIYIIFRKSPKTQAINIVLSCTPLIEQKFKQQK